MLGVDDDYPPVDQMTDYSYDSLNIHVVKGSIRTRRPSFQDVKDENGLHYITDLIHGTGSAPINSTICAKRERSSSGLPNRTSTSMDSRRVSPSSQYGCVIALGGDWTLQNPESADRNQVRRPSEQELFKTPEGAGYFSDEDWSTWSPETGLSPPARTIDWVTSSPVFADILVIKGDAAKLTDPHRRHERGRHAGHRFRLAEVRQHGTPQSIRHGVRFLQLRGPLGSVLSV